MRLPSSVTMPAALLAIVLGVAGLFATLIFMIVSYGHFLNEGTRVNLPADAVALEVRPGVEHAVFHEVTGSHITVNRPLLDLPKDAAVTISDAATGAQIEHADVDMFTQVSFFGLRDRRRAFAQFDPPASGQVTLHVADVPEGQVFYIGPTHRVYNKETLPKVQAAALSSLVLVLIGVTFVLVHLTRRSHVSLDRPVTDMG